MLRGFVFLAFSSVVASSAIQIPLQPGEALIKKPLVSSEDIQADISAHALLERAKHLSKIADLSLEEYNHPTRVIGSKGKRH
jgi:aminopeptidase Y